MIIIIIIKSNFIQRFCFWSLKKPKNVHFSRFCLCSFVCYMLDCADDDNKMEANKFLIGIKNLLMILNTKIVSSHSQQFSSLFFSTQKHSHFYLSPHLFSFRYKINIFFLTLWINISSLTILLSDKYKKFNFLFLLFLFCFFKKLWELINNVDVIASNKVSIDAWKRNFFSHFLMDIYSHSNSRKYYIFYAIQVKFLRHKKLIHAWELRFILRFI